MNDISKYEHAVKAIMQAVEKVATEQQKQGMRSYFLCIMGLENTFTKTQEMVLGELMQ